MDAGDQVRDACHCPMDAVDPGLHVQNQGDGLDQTSMVHLGVRCPVGCKYFNQNKNITMHGNHSGNVQSQSIGDLVG